MGIGFTDFQGCGKGGKQHHRFPGFPATVISTACFHPPQRSGEDLHRTIAAILLKLRWADVVQRRVHACLVIPKQPCQGFIFGLADGLKLLSMQSFYLQRTEHVSEQALSQQLPLRLIDGVMPCLLSS